MSNLSELLPAGAGAKSAKFVASGTLASGQAIALKTDGTVTAITGQVGTATTFASITESLRNAMCFDPDSNKVIIAYRDAGNSTHGYAVVGTVSGTSISFGSPVVFYSGGALNSTITAVYDTTANKVVVTFYPQAGGLYAIVGTVSGTSISFGSTANVSSAAPGYPSSVYDSSANKTLVSYSNSYPNVVAISVSGTTPSFGTPFVVVSAATQGTSLSYDTTANKSSLVITNQSSSYLKAYAITISGTTPSAGSATDLGTFSNGADGLSTAYDPDINRHIVVFRDRTSGASQYFTNYIIFQISGTSIINNTAATALNNVNGGAPVVVYDTGSNKVVVVYNTASSTISAKVGTATISSIAFGDQITVEPAINQYSIGAVYDSAADRVVVGSYVGSGIVFNAGGIPNTDFLGITNEAISNSATGEVAVQGGVITNTNLNVATAITAGSKVVFDDGGATTGIALAYDPDTAKVVNVFCTTNVQGIVGTVSGTSISYGSASSANSNSSSDAQVAYDTVNNKIVAVYKEGFNDARVVIGTVSGTAISWGTPVVFASVNAATPNVAFDTNAGKVLIVYKDQANNNYGKAVVGTVSGTSISIGSPVTFMNANANKIELVYDANAQKSVLVVQDASNNIGVAYVATISGTSVSFGSPTNFLSSALTANALAITYNSTDNKVIVGFSKGSDNKGYLTTGTVSGTSISFAGETEFSGSTTTNYISLSYKASGNVLGMAYNIGGATTVKFNAAVISGTSFSFGTEQELTAGATDITATTVDLASGNFVASYGDGSNNYDGTTNVISVATTLATGTDYFVQTDGTLSTTTSTVPAGRALSATSILLEG